MRQTEHQEASFTLLEATYLERTGLRFEPSDYVSFGLADKKWILDQCREAHDRSAHGL